MTKKPRVHDLRHTCASWMMQGRVPMGVVQLHLGIESIQTTVGDYGHFDRVGAHEAAGVIAAALAR